jgi:hypothetical protein
VAEYANPDAQADRGWVAQHVDDQAVRVIDVDEDTTAYDRGVARLRPSEALRRVMDGIPLPDRRAGGAVAGQGPDRVEA